MAVSYGYAGGIGAETDRHAVESVVLWLLSVHFVHRHCLCHFLCLLSYCSFLFGIDVAATLRLGSDCIRLVYVLLISHSMLYSLFEDYSFEDDGPTFVGARLVIYLCYDIMFPLFILLILL